VGERAVEGVGMIAGDRVGGLDVKAEIDVSHLSRSRSQRILRSAF
jgi:hypothetical protein